MVVSLGSFLVFEMHIIRTDDLNAILLSKFQQHFIGFLLQREGFTIGQNCRIFHLMTLQFEVIVITENTMIPFTSLACSFQIILDYL